jgi:hypothetical protein
MTIPVYLELGRKKIFAASLAWPGWCRSGSTEEAALDALAAYAPRYAEVAENAGLPFPIDARPRFDVIERIAGNATTDFGAPDRVVEADHEAVTPAIARRLATLVEAAWAVFDGISAQASAELRKGPRGGGRDRDKMIDHVLGAEAGYARMIGVKHRQPALGDQAAIMALRDDLLAVLGAPNDGSPPREKGWPTRYAARRIAWHVLDHAWEMQDRATPA